MPLSSDSSRTDLLAACLGPYPITIIMAIIRFYSRRINGQKYAIDDWLMIPSMDVQAIKAEVNSQCVFYMALSAGICLTAENLFCLPNVIRHLLRARRGNADSDQAHRHLTAQSSIATIRTGATDPRAQGPEEFALQNYPYPIGIAA
ncbi:MAG: hypothetical protein Q9227_007595 [Pyrenula ochraceoflavens]